VLRALWKRVTNGVMFTIPRPVKRLCEALECLTSATEALRSSVVVARDWHAEHGNVEARLEELERERHLFQAEIHGELLKAQAEYRKADNAEKRAKTAAGRDDESDNSFETLSREFLEQYGTGVQPQDANGGPLLQVPALREELETAASVVETLRAGKRAR